MGSLIFKNKKFNLNLHSQLGTISPGMGMEPKSSMVFQVLAKAIRACIVVYRLILSKKN